MENRVSVRPTAELLSVKPASAKSTLKLKNTAFMTGQTLEIYTRVKYATRFSPCIVEQINYSRRGEMPEQYRKQFMSIDHLLESGTAPVRLLHSEHVGVGSFDPPVGWVSLDDEDGV